MTHRLSTLTLLLLGFFTLLAAPAAAQWQWAAQSTRVPSTYGGATYANQPVLATGPGRRTFVAGSFRDSLQLGRNLTLLNHRRRAGNAIESFSDGFVAALDSVGSWRWAQAVGGRGLDGIFDLTVDTVAGRVLVAGTFQDTVTLGGTTLRSAASHALSTDLFVGALSLTGQWLWATQTTVPSNAATAAPARLAVGSAGEVYLVGSFTGTVGFGAFSLAATGADQAFIAGLSPTGQWQWVTTVGGVAMGQALVADPAGGVVVGGSYETSATFGTLPPPPAGPRAFVAHLSAAGQWQWVTTATTTQQVHVADLRPGAAPDQWLLTGDYVGTLTFGPTSLPSDSIHHNIFVASLDGGTLAWQWAVAADCPSYDDLARRLVVDPANDLVFVTGLLATDLNTGNPTIRPLSGTFGPRSCTTAGSADGFIGALRASTGTWFGAIPVGGLLNDELSGMGVLPGAALAVAGEFRSLSFTLGRTVLTRAPTSTYELFVAAIPQADVLVLAANGLRPAQVVEGWLLPNPAHARATLQVRAAAPQARPVTVADVAGRLVLTSQLAAGQTSLALDVADLPAGVYVVRCGTLARRLVVE